MKWFAISSLAFIILGLFFWNKFRMESRIKREGGIAKKYECLLALLMEQCPNCRVFKETSSYICFGVNSFATVTLFDVVATFSTITISYNIHSSIFGNHKLRWQFPVRENQEYMAYKINNDIGNYLSNDKRLSKVKAFFDQIQENN